MSWLRRFSPSEDAFQRGVEEAGVRIAELAARARPMASVQPGRLRQSVVSHEAGEFFIPPSRVVRDRSGCVVSFSGAPDPNGPVYDRRPVERARAQACNQTEPFLGRTPAEAAERLRVKLGHCPHGLAEDVELITGEIVAAVCPTCLEVLPAAFVGSAWKP